MPELRQDPTTKEWVIIAHERALRPDQFRSREGHSSTQSRRDNGCPFCPGNEHLTPPELYSVADTEGSNRAGWQIRVVPNKFAALAPEQATMHHDSGRLFHAMYGFGYHEVIIETPDHGRVLSKMSADEISGLLDCYCQRYFTARKDTRVKLILLFRNHGERAGTSLAHPHSQLVATPVIPFHIRKKYEVAIRHYDDTGRCLYCDIVVEEKAAGKRVVLETLHFLVFHPFASQVPFETWIVPKHHNPCFARIIAAEKHELASVLRSVLKGLDEALVNPDFNLIVHTAPVEDENKPYFLWHIEIRPRLTTAAGFELGTGMYINTAVPEETAPFLRATITGVAAKEGD